jgi:hypothetical protein
MSKLVIIVDLETADVCSVIEVAPNINFTVDVKEALNVLAELVVDDVDEVDQVELPRNVREDSRQRPSPTVVPLRAASPRKETPEDLFFSLDV